MNKSEQLNELAGALVKAQGAIQSAKKDSENPYFKSTYADLSSVWDAVRKPLSDNGLSVIQALDFKENRRVLETVLLHTSGQFISSYLDLTPKEDSSQAIGSAITYARRYALSALVGVCPEDDDAEGSMGRKVSTSRPAPKAPSTKIEPAPLKKAEPQVTKSPASVESTPVDELFDWVAVNMGWKDAKVARTWIVNVCKIPEERIDSDPEGCKQEIAQLKGWTFNN